MGILGFLFKTGKLKFRAETITDQQQQRKPQKIKFVPGEIIVKFKDSPKTKKYNSLYSEVKSNLKRPDDEFEQLLSKANLSDPEEENLAKFVKVKVKLQTKDVKEPDISALAKQFPDDPRFQYTLQERETLDLIASYKQNPNVELAEPNVLYEPSFIPNDPYYQSKGSWGQSYDDLWGTKVIQSATAWDTSQGEGVTVAVVDTGIDYNHKDIKDNIWQNSKEIAGNNIDDDNNGYIDDVRGYNFLDNNNDPMDNYGHGTHVAGTIAAIGNNGIGIIGVAPKAKVMALKVGDQYGLPWDTIFSGIYYAVNQGARVINMSFGAEGQYWAFDNLLNYASSKNVVLVAGAGNDWSGEPLLYTPAGNSKVITVGAVDSYGQRAYFSNYGLKLDVMAPGVDILSLKSSAATGLPTDRIVGEKYIRLDGTSMATPHVAGLAALILAKNPNFVPSQVKMAVKSKADDLGTTGTDLEFGYGRVNASNSLLATTPPTINLSLSSPYFTQAIRGALNFTGTASSSSFANYHLDFSTVKRPYNWGGIVQKSNSVENGTLFSWDSTKLFDEKYWIRLDVTTQNPTYTESIYTLVFPINHVREGWPRLKGWTVDAGITLDNLNGDKAKEVIVPSYSFMGGLNAIHVFKGDGSYLSGWPQYQQFWLDSAPAVADLDGDGKKDIIYGSWDGKVYARKSDGSLLPGWPQQTTVAPGGRTRIIWSAPTVYDIDKDGKFEVIIGDYNGYLNVFNNDGSIVSGWPKKISDYQYSYIPTTAAVGDIDNDGKVEIVVSLNNYGSGYNIIGVYLPDGTNKSGKPGWPVKISGEGGYDGSPILADVNNDGKQEIIVKLSSRLAIFNYDGKMLTGWPRPIGSNFSSPLVADLNNDGKLEIVVAGQKISDPWGTTIRVFNFDGSFMSGWPQLIPSVNAGSGSPLVVDIDGDNLKEIIVSGNPSEEGDYGLDVIVNSGKIYAFKSDGKMLTKAQGWPKTVGRRFWFSTPAVGDIDGDGKLELVAGSWDGVYAWDLEGSASQTGIWPTFQHDVWHTGNVRGPQN